MHVPQNIAKIYLLKQICPGNGNFCLDTSSVTLVRQMVVCYCKTSLAVFILSLLNLWLFCDCCHVCTKLHFEL